MTMNIFIHDMEETHARRVNELCLKYLVQENKEASLLITACEEEMQTAIHEAELLGIFFLAVSEELGQISGEIRKKGELNYIVLMGKTMEEILSAITPDTRPSGCVIKPADEKKFCELLGGLWEDYESIKGEEGIFRFQIKAACYAVPDRNILYFESAKKKIFLKTAGQEFEFYDSLGKIEKNLPGNFMRVHNSYIVNLNKIVKADYAAMTIYLEEDNFVYLSRSYKAELQKRLKQEG